MSTEAIQNRGDTIKKYKRRRNIGAALLIVGVLCFLLSFISSSSTSYTYYPNGQGGVIPYPTSSTGHPFLFMIVPGIAFLIAGIALIVSSRKRLKSIDNGGASTNEDAPSIDVNVPKEQASMDETPSQMIEERGVGKFCRFCGARLEMTDSFCSDCGKKVA
jgi:predicted nucleic acid-binding Zn ribbon protein